MSTGLAPKAGAVGAALGASGASVGIGAPLPAKVPGVGLFGHVAKGPPAMGANPEGKARAKAKGKAKARRARAN
eukprot:12198180-Karenia_brevis.AAC.1